MPVTLTWSDVALRLALTVLASGLFGFNRGEQGHAAGLRTMLLVGLAASVAMLQANWLLDTTGKTHDSFITLDLMRLPLGILSGIGFIGAGAIMRRGELVVGVTTAATLWFVTVVGLCFGGGQLALGSAATGLGLIVLVGMKFVDLRMPQARRARMTVYWNGNALHEGELRSCLERAGLKLSNLRLTCSGGERKFSVELRWRAPAKDVSMPAAVEAIGRRSEVTRFDWQG